MKPPIGPIPDEPPAVTDEEACESIIGVSIAGIGLMDTQVALFLEDGRTVIFEGCDKLWIEVKPRVH